MYMHPSGHVTQITAAGHNIYVADTVQNWLRTELPALPEDCNVVVVVPFFFFRICCFIGNTCPVIL